MRLLDIETALPDTVVEIEAYRDRFAHFDLAVARSGVARKYVAGPDETALDLADAAWQRLEARRPRLLETLDALIFVTQTPDHQFPGNSFLLLDRLGQTHPLINYDLNQGCAGFLYAAHLVQGMMAAGQARRVAVVFSDTYSKLIDPDDRGASLLFGDAAAVALFSEEEGPYSARAAELRPLARLNQLFTARGGAARNAYQGPPPRIEMQGAALLEVLCKHAPGFIEAHLEAQGLRMADIDLVVPHQASQIALDHLESALGTPGGVLFRNLSQFGNTTSASIPIALHEALYADGARPVRRVLVFGFGVGFSMGAMVLDAV